MRVEVIENIVSQIVTDERLFGDGLINSWTDFRAFQRAYDNESWSFEEQEVLKVAFHLLRTSIDVKSTAVLFLREMELVI